jgi:drug/metabolite transporter (DMT)-like permease
MVVRNRPGRYIVKTLILTILALIAFAANSVLCRMALGENRIDASSFTVIRLLSGVLVLLAIVKITNGKKSLSSTGSWFASLMLFLYAMTFSFAYMTLDTGTGALILFGAVQITMIFISLFSGNRLHLSSSVSITLSGPRQLSWPVC